MKKILFCLFISCASLTLHASAKNITNVPHGLAKSSTIKESLLPENHHLQNDLKLIFKKPKIFDSPDKLKSAGFKVHKRVHEGLMVSRHPSIKNYIFKKYNNSVIPSVQLEKYLQRIINAQKIRQFVEEKNFKHLVVPKKWLYQLPSNFSQYGEKAYILIVEEMDILSGEDNPKGENIAAYYNMRQEVLQELCVTMHQLGGCDAWPRNQPFTKSGKIAFVDTEHLGQKKMHFFKHIMPVLSPDNQDFAQILWDHMEYEEQLETLSNTRD